MDAYSTQIAIIAASVNVVGVKLFTEQPNETIVSTLLFTLSLAVVIDKICRNYMPKSLPLIVQIAISILVSLYVFEMLQATFWIPLERSCYKLATSIDLSATRYCEAGMGSPMCKIAVVANFVAEIGLVPVLLGASFLLGTLHAIQAPYASFLWRPKKKTWRPVRPPTPYPTANEDNFLPEDSSPLPEDSGPLPEDSSPPVNDDLEELSMLFPPGSMPDDMMTQVIATVKAVVDAVMEEIGTSAEESGRDSETEEGGRGSEAEESGRGSENEDRSS